MLNCFSLIGVPQTFDVDVVQLEKRYFELQRQFHPDRAAGKTTEERQMALQQSMNINEAYQILKSPLKRAQHLLALNGIQVNTERDSYKPDASLLMEVMELREELSGANNASIGMLLEKVQQQQQSCLLALSGAFKKAEYEPAAQLAMRLNYLTRLLDEARIKKYHEPAANT